MAESRPEPPATNTEHSAQPGPAPRKPSGRRAAETRGDIRKHDPERQQTRDDHD